MPAPVWEHGGQRVQVVGSSLAVEDSQGSRRLEPSDDPKAIVALRESSPMWLGEHFLSVGDWVVDLRSMRQRRLSRAENLRLVGASPSGHIALVHDREAPMRWARVK
jgi:hypothetical protein